jgi:hypothetical protein
MSRKAATSIYIPPPTPREPSPRRRRETPPDWREAHVPEDRRPLCYYFTIGVCRFGTVCRNRHASDYCPDEPQSKNLRLLKPTRRDKRRR